MWGFTGLLLNAMRAGRMAFGYANLNNEGSSRDTGKNRTLG